MAQNGRLLAFTLVFQTHLFLISMVSLIIVVEFPMLERYPKINVTDNRLTSVKCQLED